MYKAVSGLPRGFAALVAVCLFCLPLIASADLLPQAGKDAASGIVPGQVLVTFRDDAGKDAVARILRTYPPLSKVAGLYRLSAPVGAETATAAQLLADPAVAGAAANPAAQMSAAGAAGAAKTRSAPTARPASTPAAPATTSATDNAPTPAPDSPVASPFGGTIRSFWLSDRQAGADPTQGAPNGLVIGACQGPRFNAGRPIWANIRYENMDAQVLRVQVYSYGPFGASPAQEQLGYGWSVSVSGYNAASQPLPNSYRLPVGCYETRLYSSLDSSSSATPLARVRFQVVTTSPEMQSSNLQLWHLDHSRAEDGADLAKNWVDIKATGAWNVTTGGATTIAMIGYGVDIGHEKLNGHVWSDPTNPNVHGWNFVTNTPDVPDDYGEGTFLAGLIAARPDGITSNGGLGVNWGAKIMPLRITTPYDPVTRTWPQGIADAANVISAMSWAREKGAQVILVCLPVRLDQNRAVDQQFKLLFHQEVQRAKAAGIVVVAPVGDVDLNMPDNPPGDDLFPASFSETLTVATTDQADQGYRRAYRNLAVDVAAPGQVYMLSINNPNLPWLDPSERVDPAFVYGDTAFSAALVTGVVGLIKSVNPYLDPDNIQALLKNTADKVDTASHSYDDPTPCPSGWNEYLGCGRINAEKALLATPHDLRGALSITPINATTPGQQCARIENKRTGAVTWKVDVPLADQDWVTVTGPFSASSTDQNPDYQGKLPSYAKVCVNLGTGSGQRPYGSYPVKLTVRSTMGTTGPQVPITLSVLYAPSIAQVYLPNLAAGVSTSGQ
ncbi:MAG: S8 family serine peptidase [Anaerolineae bacterium]